MISWGQKEPSWVLHSLAFHPFIMLNGLDVMMGAVVGNCGDCFFVDFLCVSKSEELGSVRLHSLACSILFLSHCS